MCANIDFLPRLTTLRHARVNSFSHDDFESCQMKLLQHSENLLMLFNGCDDVVLYVVVEPEYVKHHHRLIKDDEFVV